MSEEPEDNQVYQSDNNWSWGWSWLHKIDVSKVDIAELTTSWSCSKKI